jgi:nitrogen PTS system EIIA component
LNLGGVGFDLEGARRPRNGIGELLAMEIDHFLRPADVMIDVRAADKARLLGDLARRAAARLGLDPDAVSAALLQREELGSTGTGGGIALPHARLAEVKKPFALLARLAKAIDFDAIDGGPVDVVCLLLLPANAQGEQLNALACAARALRDPAAVSGVRRAADAVALYDALAKASAAASKHTTPAEPRAK